VLVEVTGRPDMRTLQLSGRGASENREAIVRWIENAAFRPASRGGVPVAAVYTTTIMAR